MSDRRGWTRRLVDLTAAAYRLGLRRYPRPFRERFGERMVADFRRLLLEEVTGAGARGWLRACIRVGRDLLRPLPRRPGRLPPSSSPGGSTPIGPGPRRERGRALLDEVRAAWRSLRRRPGFALLLVGVLGVGIALNTAVFAVVDAYLLRPLPYPEAGRLVRVAPATSAVGWLGSDDVFEKAVSWSLDGFTLVGDAGPEVVLGARVSPDFFDVYGIHPGLGRSFHPAESGTEGTAVALISHALWTRRFGADPAVLGRAIRAYPADQREGLETFTVIGVLPRDFWYLNGYTDLLTPLRTPGPVQVGRLRADVPRERAEAVLTARARAAGAIEPDEADLRLEPLQDAYTVSIRPQLLALQGAALLVFLAAATSAGLLLLVRASGRAREISVRRALGAGGGRLATHLLAEAAILSTAAGVVGVGMGWVGLRALGTVIQARLGRSVPGGTEALRIDGSVALAVVGACVLVAFALGLVSLGMAGWRAVAGELRGGGRVGATTAMTARVRAGLVATQVALCVALLGGGALLVRSALHLETMQLGFDPERLEAYTVGLTSGRADDPARRASFFDQVLSRTAELPGVESACVVRAAPFTGVLASRRVEVEGGPAPDALAEVVPQIASPGCFELLGMTSVEGRLFTDDDGPGTTPVAVVSAALASAITRGGASRSGAVGARIRFTAWTMPEMEEDLGPWLNVVGVVPDIADAIDGTRPTLYVPYAQAPSAWMDLLIRRRSGSARVAEDVRTTVHELDRDTPLYEEIDVPAFVARARAPSRFFAALLGTFASFSLGLALFGLYGVAAYAARQRHRDLAVRLALGATRGSVERLFLRDAALTVGPGLAVGLFGARVLGGALGAQLHGVRPHDPATLVAVVLVVAATALAAVWIPARGAARVEISAILRDD